LHSSIPSATKKSWSTHLCLGIFGHLIQNEIRVDIAETSERSQIQAESLKKNNKSQNPHTIVFVGDRKVELGATSLWGSGKVSYP